MGDLSVAQRKVLAKKYWKIGEWNKFSFYEWQQIFDDGKTWNICCNNNSDNGLQT